MIQGDKLPTLTSRRLSLRWLEERDAADLFAIFSDPHVMRYWSSTPWTDEAAGLELVQSVRRNFVVGSLYQWGVVRRDEDAVIGTCTLAGVDARNRRAEIGFILRRDHWGRGYMLEATRTLLRFAFEQLALHRVEADVDPRNDASIRLIERLGFQREGHLRERWLVGEEINDTIMYGLLQREWQATGQSDSSGADQDSACV